MTTSSCEELQSLFDKVSIHIKKSPVTTENTVTDETKLRLYGLYKRVTAGKVNDSELQNRQRPSAWNLLERYKYDAWALCDCLSREEAMIEYVRVAAGEENEVGRACAEFLEIFFRVSI